MTGAAPDANAKGGCGPEPLKKPSVGHWDDTSDSLEDMTYPGRCRQRLEYLRGLMCCLRLRRAGEDQDTPNVFGTMRDPRHTKNALKKAEDKKRAELDRFHDGFAGRLVKHRYFERCTIIVIMINALWIGFDTDYAARVGKEEENLYKGDAGFIVAENLFAFYFSGEIILRLCAYKEIVSCFFDGWFVFDSFLVALMVMETWLLPVVSESGNLPIPGTSVFRLLRLLRIARMAKLMRTFPEILVIIRGLTAASKAVAWTAVLLVTITFTWAILFTSEFHQGKLTDDELDDGQAEKVFGSMGKSMKNLLIMGTILDDVTYCTDSIRGSENMGMLIAFIIYILLNSFTMLNMLVGILVEVVGTTAAIEQTRLATTGAAEQIKRIFDALDEDGSGRISREEFLGMRGDKAVMKALAGLKISAKDFEVYAELLFDQGGEEDQPEDEPTITYDQLVKVLKELRPGVPISALSFAEFKQSAYDKQESMKARIRTVRWALGQISGQSLAPTPEVTPEAVPIIPNSPGRPLEIPNLELVSTQDIVAELQRRHEEEQAMRQHPDDAEATSDSAGPEYQEPDWNPETLSC